jgi:uncharacterized peroxidase-related enzyme
MPRVAPIDRDAHKELAPTFDFVEQAMGFLPNSMLTMARNPALLQAFGGLGAAALGPGKAPADLKGLVSFVVSRSAGCQYCMAHTSHTSVNHNGVPQEKFDGIWEYETSPLFSEGERAALRVAQGAGQVPNAVTDEDFQALKQHYDDDQIVEIVAVISFFGFLNRWNDTMATELESAPKSYAQAALGDHGWDVGKHAAK